MEEPHPMEGKLVAFIKDYPTLWDKPNGTESLANKKLLPSVMRVVKVETDSKNRTLYLLEAVEGTWDSFYEGYRYADSTQMEEVVVKEPCPTCGKPDCSGHTWCDICEEYDCGKDHTQPPAEPENPCDCCDKCTGEEGCTCVCGKCDFCEKEPEDELVDGPIYGTINGQTITVSGTLPQSVTVKVAPADVSQQLAQFDIPADKLVFGLDISLRKNGADYQPGAAVRVKVPVSAAEGTKIGILHTHGGETTYIGLTEVLPDGTVEFTTDRFSTFAGFTVDFHYNEIDYSIVGLSSIKLSELFTILEIDRQASNAASVVFSDTSLIKVTKTDGDWLLESLKAFDTTEKLEITFINGEIITIVVTDASKGVQTTNDQVHLSTSGTSKTYQIFGKLYPDVNGDYTSFATTLFGVEVDFVLYEGNAYPGSGNGSTVGTAWIDQAAFGVQFSLTGSYWYEVYDTYRCQVSEKTGTDNFVFDSTNISTGRKVYIRRYPRTTYYNDNYCKVTQASVMSDSKTTRTVYVHTNGNETPIGSWTGYFPDRTSAAASDLSVVPYKEWRLSKVEVSDGNYHVYLYSVHTITWQNSDKDNTVLEIDENVKYGDAPSYNGSPPTKPDDEGYYYTFKGWSPTVSDVTGNQTYVAEYTKNPYTYYISFNGNGATSGSMNNQSFKFGTAQALTANTYKREYTVTYNTNGGNAITAATAKATFNGWEDHGTIVYQGTTYGYPSFDVPYYANSTTSTIWPNGDIWGTFGYNKYRIMQHYVDHGKGEVRSIRDSSGVYWTYPDKATVSNMSSTAGATVELYANWTLGSVTLPKPEKEDHIFQGWYSDAALTKFVGDAGDSYPPTGNVTLYAKWEENYEEFTISYNLNGGTLPEGKTNPESYTKKDSFTLNNPTKPAHTFTGWTGSNGTTPSTNVTIPTGSTGARSYTANWTEKNYTITYDHDYTDEEGNQVISTEDYTIISTSGLLNPTRRGYEFLGWKLETGLTPPNGNWTAGTYSAGNPVTEKYGDVTLVAQWKSTGNSLTYAYTGEHTPTDTSCTLPEEAIVTPDTEVTVFIPTAIGYTFSGWTPSVTSVQITEGKFQMPDEAVVLTGSWTPIPYKITYDYNNGDSTTPSKKVEATYTIKDAVKLMAAPAKADVPTDFLFTGWKLAQSVNAPNGNWTAGTFQTEQQFQDGHYGNITLVAQWERAAKDLTIRANSTDSDVNFVYTISGQGITITVAVPANSSVTIKSMPVGDYTITEKTAWSWRHTDNYQNHPVTITKTEEEQSVVFDYLGNENKLWLNGYSYGKKGG